MNAAVVLPFLVVAAVLVLSGAAKLTDQRATEDMFESLRVPLVPAAPSARVLPYAEILLGFALLVVPAPALVVVAVATVVLFLAYWALIARALTFDPPVSCACFGRLGGHRVTRATLVRNTILVALAGVVLVASVRGVDLVDAVRAGDAGDGGWLVLAAATVALTWLIARTDTSDATVPANGLDDEEYHRLPIPYGILEQRDGTTTTLRELAHRQARLLVMLSGGCGSCTRTAQKLDGWAAALDGTVAVHAIYGAMPAEDAELPHAHELVLRQPDLNVSHVLGTNFSPMAVLLGADGMLAGGPVLGEHDIEQLVNEVLEQLAADT